MPRTGDFKRGDRVKVKGIIDAEPGERWLEQRGIIVAVEDADFPLVVEFDEDMMGLTQGRFAAEELEHEVPLRKDEGRASQIAS